MFAPLHTKSEHSPGYGSASVEELLSRARAYGYSAVALTDVENLYGQIRFHHAARVYGIKPISGVSQTVTIVVLSTSKEETAIDIPLPREAESRAAGAR